MNVEKLNKIASFILEDIKNNQIVENFASFINNFNNFVSNMQHAPYQTSFSQSRDNLFKSLDNCTYNNMSFFEKEIIKEIGGENFLGINLKNNLMESLEKNQMTPAQAYQEITPMHSGFSNFINQLSNLKAALDALNIEEEDNLDNDQGIISFLLPRDIIDGELDLFEKDIKTFKNFLNVIHQLSGDTQKYQIHKISSSDFVIDILAYSGTIYAISKTINEILKIFKNYLEVRELKEKFKGIQSSSKKQKEQKKIEDDIDKFIQGILEDNIETISNEIIIKSEIKDMPRKNELKANLIISLKQLVAKLDNGYQINVTSKIDENNMESDDEKLSKLAEEIASLNQNTSFLAAKISGQGPILSLPAFSNENEED